MTFNPADSAILSELFSDAEVAAAFTDEAVIAAMVEFEVALARVQGRLGVIPADAARRIEQAAAGFKPDMAGISGGAAAAGVPVVPLVQQLRGALGGAEAGYVHWGATSQDVIDTGLAIRLSRVLPMLSARLDSLIGRLADLADEHRNTVMAARTRTQQAVPTTFGLKAATWAYSLAGIRDRLAELRPRALAVQFGSAAGTLSALGENGVAVMEALANELELEAPAAPWTSQRESVAELGGWLSLVTGSIGKMAQDLMLMAQNEVAEVLPGEGGGSSTMPQKANPVGCEVMVTAARVNASLVSALHHALIQEHERGGPGWQVEWAVLPQMVGNAGGALKHALAVTGTLRVDATRMRANLDASNGLILAEAAGFALAAHMPRHQAQALVKEACRAVAETGRPLFDILRERTDAPVDWDAVADPANYLGETNALIDRILEKAHGG